MGGYSNTIAYDVLGNITSKSDVGRYTYGQNGAGPHAVTAVNGVINNSYTYDANGNRVSSSAGTITYTSFNKPHTLEEGNTTLQFLYGPTYSRYQQTVIKNDVISSIKTYIGGVYEQEVSENLMKHIHYILAGGESIAIYTAQSDDQNTTRYLHKDHLGSFDVITDEQGMIVENLSFDAWGNRRSANWEVLTEEEILTLLDEGLTTARGFTGHKHLDEIQLIHMNGRLYDPMIGRFLSADPIVQAPTYTQSLNRYSYVLNNPLSLVDPSGYFFKKLGRFFKKLFKKHIVTVASIALGAVTAGISLAIGGALGIVNTAVTTVKGMLSTLGGAVVANAGFGFGSAFSGTLMRGGGVRDALKAGLKAGIISAVTVGVLRQIGRYLPNLHKTAPEVRASLEMTELSIPKRLAIQLTRNLIRGVVNATESTFYGGKFKRGFASSLVSDSIRLGIEGFTEYRYRFEMTRAGKDIKSKFLEGLNLTYAKGRGVISKNLPYHESVVDPGANNVGLPYGVSQGMLVEGSPLMEMVNTVPGMNTMAVFHDYFVGMFSSGNFIRDFIINQMTIPVAIGVTYTGLGFGQSMYKAKLRRR